MNIEDVKTICVVGAGNMGHQISTLCAIKGYNTTCTDISEEVLKKAEAFVDGYLPGRVKKGKMTEDEAQGVRQRLRFTRDLAEAVKDADYVIEAAIRAVISLFRSMLPRVKAAATARIGPQS